jgi:hypothetical protein
VDILEDGSLDYDDELLAGFDYVVASVHSLFGMPEDVMTKRVCKALAHPAVTSDVRHVDIGLTGKSDAMSAVTRGLVLGRGRNPRDLLVLGDTFGVVADGQGTGDYRPSP